MSSEPETQRPTTNRSVQIARGMIVVCVAFIFTMKFAPPDVSRVERDGAVVYTLPVLFPILFAVLALGAGVAAYFFWRARHTHPVFRLFALVLAVVSLFQLFNAPTGLSHHLIVTPDTFELRIGHWYAPIGTKVEYRSQAYASVVDAEGGGYALYTITDDGIETSAYIGDLMKAALPDILREMARHDVLIGERPDGWQLPEDLMP